MANLTPFEEKIHEAMLAFFAQMTDDRMLDCLAAQEMRICMLELGLTI